MRWHKVSFFGTPGRLSDACQGAVPRGWYFCFSEPVGRGLQFRWSLLYFYAITTHKGLLWTDFFFNIRGLNFAQCVSNSLASEMSCRGRKIFWMQRKRSSKASQAATGDESRSNLRGIIVTDANPVFLLLRAEGQAWLRGTEMR